MRYFLIILTTVLVIGCNNQDLIEVRLKVHVESGVTGYTHEGNRIQISGDFIQIETIDAEGNAYFEFEAEEGDRLYVMFLDDNRNFNPQGMAAYEWSPVLTSDVHAKDFFVGEEPKVELLVIPSTRLTIYIDNERNEDGDSLHVRVHHELFTTGADLNEDRPGISIQSSSPIGRYTYEGISYSVSDTQAISGHFDVPHGNNFFYEIIY